MHQLAALGVAWPPREGWRRKLVGSEIPDDDYQRFLDLANVSKKDRRSGSPTGAKTSPTKVWVRHGSPYPVQVSIFARKTAKEICESGRSMKVDEPFTAVTVRNVGRDTLALIAITLDDIYGSCLGG